MTLPRPRNAQPIIDMRLQGQAPADGVIVSYVGSTPWHRYMPHVYCDSGQAYTFDFLAGLQTILVVKPGIDAKHTIWALWRLYLNTCNKMRDGMPMIIDIERESLGWISSDNPKAWMLAKDDHPARIAMFYWGAGKFGDGRKSWRK